MTTNTGATGRKPSRRRGSFLLIGMVVTFTACGSVGALPADSPKSQEAESTDPLFTQPYVDVDEWRDTPVRHRYVHGGFKGTETRFSMYFPPKEQYQRRFFQPLPARAGVDNTSQRASGPNTPIGFAVASGGYLVDSNQGYSLGSPSDKALIPWRANAAVAQYSRVLAAEMYGPGRPYGYVYGGSGGAYKTFGSIENAPGVWDGAVPYIHGTPMSLPNNYTVRGHAMRVLKGKFSGIIDAVEPGGSGDIYAGLNKEQREALTELTRMGVPPRALFFHERLGMGPLAGTMFANLQKSDPTYFDDFWTKPGYLGANPPASLLRDRVQYKTTLSQVKVELDQRQGAAVGTMGFATLPKGDLAGAAVTLKSGAASGHMVVIDRVVDGVARVGFNPDDLQALSTIKAGDEVQIDNSMYLAAQTYHRHQVPSPDYHGYAQYRGPDGKPLHPQRAALMGLRQQGQSSGSAQNGRFSGKMIVLQMLVDEHTHPWSADWYRSKVKDVLGSRIDDHYRLWYVDHALHGQPAEQTDNIRVINYTGILQQALRDLSAWVEKGVPPPPTTSYNVVDGQVQVPPGAEERKGVQPVVTLTANGGARAEAGVGKPVTFSGVIEVPPNTGTVVAAEWDFEGAGDYPAVEQLKDTQSSRVTLTTTHVFSRPGTYFPALRAASQRQGDARTPYARALNLGRVRVVVK